MSALPAQQRLSGAAVLAAMIDGVEPVPEPLVQLLDRQQRLGIERVEKLARARNEKKRSILPRPSGPIGRLVDDENADGGAMRAN